MNCATSLESVVSFVKRGCLKISKASYGSKIKRFVMTPTKQVILSMKLIPQKYLESETCIWGFSLLRVKKIWVEMQDIQQTDHWV